MKVMVMGVVLIRCFNESKHMKEGLIMKMDNWQYLGRLTIFGLNGGCTSRASTFSQSILLKWENWKNCVHLARCMACDTICSVVAIIGCFGPTAHLITGLVLFDV